MTEKQAKKVFLKQASPFLRRYKTERKRTNVRRRLTTDFKASVLIAGEKSPVFAASFHDVVRGPVSLRVPILFALPVGFERGFKFTSASEFENFQLYCEGK